MYDHIWTIYYMIIYGPYMLQPPAPTPPTGGGARAPAAPPVVLWPCGPVVWSCGLENHCIYLGFIKFH